MIEDIIRQVARLQRQVDGLVKPEVARWVDWTPQVLQSGAVTVTITYARYKTDLDGTVTVQARLTVTSGGSGGNAVVITNIPAAIAAKNPSTYTIIGSGFILNTTASIHYHGALMAVGASDWRIITDGSSDFLGTNPSFALANNHQISLQAVYERA